MLSVLMAALAAGSATGPAYEGIAAPCATYQRLIDLVATDFEDIRGDYRASLSFATTLNMPRASSCLITDDVPRPVYRCEWQFSKGSPHQAEARLQTAALAQDSVACAFASNPSVVETADGIAVEVPDKAVIKVALVGNDDIGWTSHFEIARKP